MKIACFFPGIGYTADRPLLYYSRKIAKEAGYEIKIVPYGGFERGIFGDSDKMRKAFDTALGQTEEILKDIVFDKYDDILFVSKSVGTAVSSYYADVKKLKIRNVLYTPVPQTMPLIKNEGIIFHGTADPWYEQNAFMADVKDKDFRYYLTEGGDHSLETGDMDRDFDNLKEIMRITEKFINRKQIENIDASRPN
ncbi:MAG: alpha/beta hydrolase [Lachnospiraceae bacterium]|nr:alpha/beta hydrolase [Lachnospiraceae bacterium]